MNSREGTSKVYIITALCWTFSQSASMSKPKKANALDIHFHQFSEMAAKPIIYGLHFLSRRKPAQTGKTEPENTKVKRFAFDPRKKKKKKKKKKSLIKKTEI
jgi:hypothetical protein